MNKNPDEVCHSNRQKISVPGTVSESQGFAVENNLVVRRTRKPVWLKQSDDIEAWICNEFGDVIKTL